MVRLCMEVRHAKSMSLRCSTANSQGTGDLKTIYNKMAFHNNSSIQTLRLQAVIEGYPSSLQPLRWPL
jgi:hypothetical protein